MQFKKNFRIFILFNTKIIICYAKVKIKKIKLDKENRVINRNTASKSSIYKNIIN